MANIATMDPFHFGVMMQALIEDWREWQEAIWEGVQGLDMREPYPALHFEEDEACRRETRLVYILVTC